MKSVRKYKLVPVEEAVETGKMSDCRILTFIPKHMQTRAKMILEYLGRIPNIEWNELGVVSIDGQVVPSSHIAEYIKACLYEYKNINSSGFTQFYNILVANNVPSLVKRTTTQNTKKWSSF